MNATKTVPSKVEVTPAGTAEIDVELSDSDTEQKPQEIQRRKINSMSHCDRPADMNCNRAEYDLGRSSHLLIFLLLIVFTNIHSTDFRILVNNL